MSVQRKKRANLRELVMMAVFAALAFAAMFVFRFNVTFLTFDLKDSVITISGRGDKDCAAIARYRGEDLHE